MQRVWVKHPIPLQKPDRDIDFLVQVCCWKYNALCIYIGLDGCFLGLLWMTKSCAHNRRKRNGIAMKRKPSPDVNTKLGKYIHSEWSTGLACSLEG